MALVKYIVFSLNEQKYCMQLNRIQGIECSYNIIPIPLGAANVKGIINLRNNVIPIYSLKQKFGMPDIPGPNAQILISQTHDIKLAFEVDDVLGIVTVEQEDVKKVPNVVRSEETGYLENVVKLTLPEQTKEEIVVSIAVDRIMSDEDFGQVADALEETKKEEEVES